MTITPETALKMGFVRTPSGNWLPPEAVQTPKSKQNASYAILEGKNRPLESDLHDQIEAELKRRRYYYVHSRMDRPTTQQLGVADFIIATPNGRTLWVEAKRKGGKLTKEQTVTKHCLMALGHSYATVFNFQEFLDFIDGKIEPVKT